MQKFIGKIKSLWNDESAQGATEYILLVIVVVGLVLIFQKQIGEAIKGKLGDLSTSMGQVTSGG